MDVEFSCDVDGFLKNSIQNNGRERLHFSIYPRLSRGCMHLIVRSRHAKGDAQNVSVVMHKKVKTLQILDCMFCDCSGTARVRRG